MSKFYAVKKGRHPGVYNTWDAAKKQVSGFSGAVYKSFATGAEARAFIAGSSKTGVPVHKRSQPISAEPLKPATIIAFTDGGSRNHGNVAGGHVLTSDKAAWAYRLELPNNEVVSDSAGEWGATNNRMEIMALVKVLTYLVKRQLQHESIRVVMDSKYVLDAINKGWLAGWKRRNWHRSGNAELKNSELWRQLGQLLAQFNHLQFVWTKGHADNSGNVFVDQLLNQTMDDMKPNKKPATTSLVNKPTNGTEQLGLFDD